MHVRTCRQHPDRAVSSRDMCAACYARWWKRTPAGQRVSEKRCSRHPDRPVKARGLCHSCYEGWWINRDPERKQRKLATLTIWARRNRDKRKAAGDRWRAKPENREQIFYQQRFAKYGITREQYNALADSQHGCCAVCLERPAGRLRVDHCHDTGVIRGLLCHKCNSAIGLLGDTAARLERALAYLQRQTKEHVA